ncbi:TetR/AcrR family transcriptional regulator [Streptantibioticus parmotrematis]|uniref:TetR/AcrR family transcriptional regulator n=1 Tax=Streptantibioticus parmotrematis TaxID=2873249 RepID=UPI00340FC1AA
MNARPEGPYGPLRRRPVQRRSAERLERILDASARLLEESGYGALTTREVARRAEVPIGTLYQFFTGKDALVAALAERNLERYLARLARRIECEAPAHVAALTDLAVEEFVAMKRAVPGFGVLDFGVVGPPGNRAEQHILDAVLDNNAAVAQRLGTLIDGLLEPREGAGPEGGADPSLALRVAMECADAVLQLAFRVDPDGDPALIAECKRVLRRYLAPEPG